MCTILKGQLLIKDFVKQEQLEMYPSTHLTDKLCMLEGVKRLKVN